MLEYNYHFSDFTFSNYLKILKIGLINYQFVGFNEENSEKKRIILRHDLEFSVPIALKMAQIEADLNIRSTYFIQLHSEFYNVLEKGSIQMIMEIMKLGHSIGLHFDTHFWNIAKEDELEKYLMIDKKVLENYLDVKIEVFSFHNNTDFTLSCRNTKYAGLLNVYSNYYRENYGYNADSLGYWRYERLEDRLKGAKEDALQILIHDGMWQDEVLPPRQRVFKVIDDRAVFLKNSYDDFLKKIGEKNIDWEGAF